ncbi:hypothetical protein AVEN_54864-1 [Araneus ventricosus]|uniref:Uncharacterized protein n=1 Tax=Araneus ventricosus TaxID=182803 RepID=A0A4Y2PL56_ARAVE|nr:hypothetical protein AVEN_81861-1 [Araneus ventricosus]GBN52034.1 hypothetical protein AVEN_54864-1 [Araneus ventricosus]
MVSSDVFLSNMVSSDVFSSNMVSSDVFLSNMVSSDVFLSNTVSSDVFLSNMVSSDVFLSNMVSSDVFLSNMVSRYQTYSQRKLEISLPHGWENAWEGVTKRISTSAWKKFWSDSVVECDIEESETVPNGAYSKRDCVFG